MILDRINGNNNVRDIMAGHPTVKIQMIVNKRIQYEENNRNMEKAANQNKNYNRLSYVADAFVCCNNICAFRN